MGELNELGKIALATARSKGFMKKRKEDPARQIALMHSELSEALEADRKGKVTTQDVNDTLTNAIQTMGDKQFMKFYEKYVKGNFEEEMADLLIRNVQYSTYRKLDLDLHVAAKMRYNSLRPHKHGGKKY